MSRPWARRSIAGTARDGRARRGSSCVLCGGLVTSGTPMASAGGGWAHLSCIRKHSEASPKDGPASG